MTVKHLQSFFFDALWGLFLIAFIALGYSGSGTSLLPDALTRSTIAGNQYATTDAYFKTLKVPRPSEYIQAALAELPSSDPILFVGWSNATAFESKYFAISYLSWPRQVYVLGCSQSGQSPHQFKWAETPAEGLKIAGILFYQIAPPSSLPGGKAIGPLLKLVPASETMKWTSYCSQPPL